MFKMIYDLIMNYKLGKKDCLAFKACDLAWDAVLGWGNTTNETLYSGWHVTEFFLRRKLLTSAQSLQLQPIDYLLRKVNSYNYLHTYTGSSPKATRVDRSVYLGSL